MKAHIAGAVAIFMLGAITGHTMTAPASVRMQANVAQVSPFDLTLKATNLPAETADAI
jgi:hypothetical protein